MSELAELPVFQKTYDLYRAAHDVIKKFEKGDRYALGEKLKTAILDVLEAIIQAGSAKKEFKIPFLERALIKMEVVKIFVRLGADTRNIPISHALELQETIQTVCRMLGGWRRSL